MIATNVTLLRRTAMRTRAALVFASFAVLALLAPAAARAQATYTADRIDGASVFGGYGRLNTDYGQTDDAYVFGADLTHSVGLRFITPSLEVRYQGSTGPAITENSFLGGFKFETKIHRIRPYANLLIGYGVINYVQVNQNDNSIAYDGGAGIDFQLTRALALKVDAQEQFWKLGQATNELTPQSVSIGILYRLPLGWGRR